MKTTIPQKESKSNYNFSKDITPLKYKVTSCNITSNVHFLKPLNQGPKDIKDSESILVENQADDYLADIQKMKATELSKKYSLTYSTWKNMKTRCKKGGVLSPEFVGFRSFLLSMGPRPNKQFTVDRIDHKNLNYSPHNCRWADKHTQNQNKSNNVYLTYKDQTFTVSVWARRTNQKADTLYHRKNKGWSDEETITGKKLSTISENSLWPVGYEEAWESAFKKSQKKCKLTFLLKNMLEIRQRCDIEAQEKFNPNGDETESECKEHQELSARYEKCSYYINLAKSGLEKKLGYRITSFSQFIT